MILATANSLSVWNALRHHRLHARTLAAGHFLDFKHPDPAEEDRSKRETKKDWRRRSCEQIRDGRAMTEKLAGWRSFCRSLPGGDAALLFARLRARLIVNAGGGVLENGGLCLDRTSGLPFIPGSAVKGCARRFAIAALREWSQSGQQRVEPEELQQAVAAYKNPIEMLIEVAWIFGWVESDWKKGRKPSGGSTRGELQSDYEFACGEGGPWESARLLAAASLLDRLGVGKPPHPEQPWLDLPNFGGAVGFLPAFPWCADPGIELDVVTPHHTAYYEGTLLEATDTEEPTPSVFPVVNAANAPLFVFPLVPSPRAHERDIATAREWLRGGLRLLGIGGKTAAGYGWFDSSLELDRATLEEANLERLKKEQETARLHAEAERRALAERDRRQREELRLLTANMTPQQKADFEIKDWDESRLKNHFDRFAKLTSEQQGAVYRLLRGPRAALWIEIRKLAQEGKAKDRSRWGKFTSAIFQMAKQQGEKMP